MASEGGGLAPPWILKISEKKLVFLISRRKKQILPIFALLGKILEKPPVSPPGKNPSDACGHDVNSLTPPLQYIQRLINHGQKHNYTRVPRKK